MNGGLIKPLSCRSARPSHTAKHKSTVPFREDSRRSALIALYMYHRALTGIYSIKARGQHFDSIIANSLLFNTPLSVRLLQLDAKMPPIEIQTESMLKENALLRRFGCEMKNSKIRMPQFMNADRFKRIIGSIDCVVFGRLSLPNTYLTN